MFTRYTSSTSKPFKLTATDFEAKRTQAEGMFLGLRFSNEYPNILATATTDGAVVLWECYRNEEKAEIVFEDKVCDQIWSFCWDGSGRTLFVSDFESGSIISVENGRQDLLISRTHQTPVHSLQYWEKERLLITAGYDSAVHLWDLRATSKPATSLWTNVSGSASLGNNMLLVIDDNNQSLNVFDLRELLYKRNPEFVKFSAKTTGQIVKSAVNKKDSKIAVVSVRGELQTFALSIEARAKLQEYYEREQNDTGFYMQSVHQSGGHEPTYYQVNDVLFNPEKDYLTITGGSDGTVYVSNTSAKKMIKSFQFSETWPVMSLAINNKYELMAVALGNDYHLGWEGRDKFKPAHLILKKINDATFRASSAYDLQRTVGNRGKLYY